MQTPESKCTRTSAKKNLKRRPEIQRMKISRNANTCVRRWCRRDKFSEIQVEVQQWRNRRLRRRKIRSENGGDKNYKRLQN